MASSDKTSDLATRLLEGDPGLFKEGSVAANRLGWLRSPHTSEEVLEDLNRWAESINQGRIVILGMGGSSLGPRVLADFAKALGRSEREVHVLDSTDPRSVAAVDTTDTAFIVSSKSGTTTESHSLFQFFYQRIPKPERFIAITDAGTPLDSLARELRFKRVFNPPSDVGGRFSIFTEFGLVPAALAGINLVDLCAAAAKTDPSRWVEIGQGLGDQARAGVAAVEILCPAGQR